VLDSLAATGLPVIEDAAQALDAAGVGSRGKMTTYSFFPSKNLGAAGDAGLVTTSDDALADRLRLLRTHGSRPKYVHQLIGGNFRLDALQAALLAAKLPHLEGWNAKRRSNMTYYREHLGKTPLALPSDAPGHVWHHFVVRAPRRDELKAHLAARGVESEVYYPLPLHLQPCFAPLGGKEGALPHAELASKEALALPVHPDLTAEQLDHVVKSVREFYA
jgi:dTDP-4-amino-4,6-dideoxygalactose transaminase